MNDKDLDDLIRSSLRVCAERISARREAGQAVLRASTQARDGARNLAIAIPILIAAAAATALVISLVPRPADQLPDATRASRGVEPTTGTTDSPDPGPVRGLPDAAGLGPITSCADVPNLPTDVEVDTVLAREFGQLMISFTDPSNEDAEQVQFVLEYEADSTCRQRADIQRVLDEALGAGKPDSAKPESGTFSPAADCPHYRPAQLPSGGRTGARRPYPEGSPTRFSTAFGSGRDLIVVNRGREAVLQAEGNLRDFPRKAWPGPVIDGSKRSVVWVGDPPSGTVQIRFLQGTCAYVIFLNPEGAGTGGGFTPQDVLDYAKLL